MADEAEDQTVFCIFGCGCHRWKVCLRYASFLLIGGSSPEPVIRYDGKHSYKYLSQCL